MSNNRKIPREHIAEKIKELQEKFSHLQAAIREGRFSDQALYEAQFSQNLCEWQAEVTAPTPQSSLLSESHSLSQEIARLLKFNDEEDDVTSALKEHAVSKPEGFAQSPQRLDWDELFNQSPLNVTFPGGLEGGVNNSELQGQYVLDDDFDLIGTPDFIDPKSSSLDMMYPFDYIPSELGKEHENGQSNKVDGSGEFDNYPELTTPVSVPPSSFMRPLCALWDCARPALAADWYYCNEHHMKLAVEGDSPGSTPFLISGGISLKDNLLVDALRAKTQGKNVGIPVCEGAVNTKCPWNASELFNLELAPGETIREWLFFDKPRRAYDSGNRKQRSLPDYSGRGWHESRKQLMKEQEGQKRSYYMDPQPPGLFEWHLFEYQINESDEFALYRLELKLTTGKKSPKTKVPKDPLADLEKKMEKMGQLTPEAASDKPSAPTKGRAKATKGAKLASGSMTQDTTVPAPTYGSNNHTNEPFSHQ